MPFILPAEGQPASESMSLDREWELEWNWQPTWQWLSSLSLAQLQLPLAILAAVFVLLAVRAFLLARITGTPAKEQPLLEKGQRMESEKTTWLVFSLFKTPAPAPDMLEAQTQAHFDVPVVHVHRPRAQKPSQLAIDTPLPTVYVSEVPASMAKLIMSRHTFRRVSPPSSPTTSRSPRRSPSPPKYSSVSPSSDAP
ncbi:hypothetical protein C8F01DRAFT_1158310 [Mycena amicta]|nr:hypothetical protein C8F01DRAFT_1158310 [Mycena amicta]